MKIKDFVRELELSADNYAKSHNCNIKQDMAAFLMSARWTMSKADKEPIDMPLFIATNGAAVKGAASYDYRTTYSTIMDIFGLFGDAEIPNLCFRLDFATHPFMVVDIEPECPQMVKDELLDKLDYVYLEKSMSGKGYHALMYAPELLTHEMAVNTSVVKSGLDYEVLISDHCVTFTGNTVSIAAGPNADANYFDETIETMFSNRRILSHKLDTVNLMTLDDVENHDYLIGYLNNIVNQGTQLAPMDYSGDMSRFEFSVGLSVAHKVSSLLTFGPKLGLTITDAYGNTLVPHEYTDDELVACMHYCLVNMLPHRSKHQEFRQDMPWLYYVSYKAYETYLDTN